MSRRPTVAVVGDGRLDPGDPREALAEAVGRAIVDAGWTLVTGGLGGVMLAACRGGRSSPAHHEGAIVGLLPGHDPNAANEWVDVAIPTGFDVGRNVIVAHADALVAVGGGAGTLAELALGWQLHRLLVGLRVDGWSGRLADARIDHRVRYAHVPDDRVYGADDAAEVVAILSRWLPVYTRRHRGVPSAR